ncbi:accessory regulator protein B [Clostridium homopropionicum DSM 5847]|uniref:Accessory regulator protein B n=1 Tax=Clostridium homopropionicum DSM 5847 TaxID=1121318 RepID=A0A0L6ZAJ6_9CLOT|nr:accessory gene regulator B family protein [Clostridium homopropionicum]KOA19999.1 accessory regulator protein B [Clostridium homopropionicum DSM 5847]SFG64360.1 accessory gene regulator B [Clostridium homopropionicum]
MFLTERVASNIGIKSRKILNIDENQEKIIVYGAISLLQIVWSIGWTAIFGLIFGVFYEAMLFSIIISALRKYSGGVHASAPNICVIIGTTISVGFGIIMDKILISIDTSIMIIVGIVCVLIALIIIIKNAPVDSLKKPITNPVIKQRFKLYSIILICFYMLCMITLIEFYSAYGNLMYFKAFQCIAFGALWQAITLTSIGAVILNKVDAGLKYILGGN